MSRAVLPSMLLLAVISCREPVYQLQLHRDYKGNVTEFSTTPLDSSGHVSFNVYGYKSGRLVYSGSEWGYSFPINTGEVHMSSVIPEDKDIVEKDRLNHEVLYYLEIQRIEREKFEKARR